METLEQKWRRRFENFGKGYDEDHLISGWSVQGLTQRLELLKKNLSSIRNVNFTNILDLGCGPGTYVRYLCESYGRVVGLDYSISSLQKALKKDEQRKGAYIGGEAYYLPFKDDSFDLVLSIGTLQSLEEPEKVVSEIRRVLRPEGMVVLEFLNSYDVVNFLLKGYAKVLGQPTRVRSYSWGEVHELLLKNQIQPFLRKGIFLLPRKIACLTFILQIPPVYWIMNQSALFSAHAFLLFGTNLKSPHKSGINREGG